MRFELVVALRHLRSGGIQTVLTVSGVAVGVALFVFIAALINGLGDRLVRDTIGNASHVTLTIPDKAPPALLIPGGAFTERQSLGTPVRGIDGWKQLIPLLEAQQDVRAVSPLVSGGGFVRRGEQTRPVVIRGVPGSRPSAIVDLESAVKSGRITLGDGQAVIGRPLAVELGLNVGQVFQLAGERGLERPLRVAALVEIGAKALDEGAVFISLEDAQTLLQKGDRVDAIELKVREVFAAGDVALRLGRLSGLEATSWKDNNKNLLRALQSQAGSGQIIKIFSLVAVAIGISGVLMVSVIRRRGEIGIMRSFGVQRSAITTIFLLQGVGIGVSGALLGMLAGFVFATFLQVVTRGPDGISQMPIDPYRGEYLYALLASGLAGAVAGILPARAAAAIEPAQAMVGQ